MNYAAAINDFFKSPRWLMNMLLAGVCAFLPVIGIVFILGWLIEGFWARQEEDFTSFPPFEFSRLERYLKLGLWPTAVLLVVSIVPIPVMWILMLPAALLIPLLEDTQGGALLVFLAFAGLVVFVMLLALALILLLVPLMLRATLTQNFAKAFDFRFAKQFLRLTWKETLLSMLFLWVAAALLGFAGMLIFCVGVYFVSIITYFAWIHLEKQLYHLYLSRGGEPVPMSEDLTRLALPAVPPA